MYRFVLAAAVAFALPIALAPFSALASQVSPAEDGARKVNISGRQRMLTQRMSKAVCFANLGVAVDMHRNMALSARDLFDRSLNGLMNGDAELGMLPERDANALLSLDAVRVMWSEFGPAVEASLAPGGTEAARIVFAKNAALLKQSNAAVSALVIAHGSGALAPDIAIAINIAGRQRMLSQKMAKEFCEVATGLEVAAARQSLAETVSLFESSHIALRDGDATKQIIAAPSREIAAKLAEVEELWMEMKPVIEAVINGAVPGVDDLNLVADKNNPLLSTMNEAVGLYEGV